MAGVLPGVEYARRRRFHPSGGSSDSPTAATIGSTRRPSFCLYTTNYETHHSSFSSQAYEDEKLGEVAREAKERLDEKLRSQRKSEHKRQNSKESLRCVDGRCSIQGELHTEMLGSKKSAGQRRFSWAKLSWKASDKAGETLVHHSCSHRFRSRCLVPRVSILPIEGESVS
ncbi:hypothetical protein DITRI_Ditri07aG0032600 [Diplodiscus trichospermus]